MFFKVKISFQRTLDLIIRTWNWELTWRYRSWRAAVLSDMTSLKTKELLTICWLAMFSLSKGKKWPQDPGAERKPIKPSFLIGKTGTRGLFCWHSLAFWLGSKFYKAFFLVFQNWILYLTILFILASVKSKILSSYLLSSVWKLKSGQVENNLCNSF